MEVKLDDNLVCISALIDNSGSMGNLDTDKLAQGLTKMIKEQCLTKEVIFYGATFNDTFNIFADGVNGNDVNITKDDIKPDGMTALFPSFARMIKFTGNKIYNTDRKPAKIIFILLSDGEQTVNQLRNAINEDEMYEGFSAKDNLKKLIEEHSQWDFLYLGTNYDSLKAGMDIGIAPSQCLNYAYTPHGSQQVMKVCSQAMSRITSNNFTGFEQKERKMAMDDINDI